MQITSWIVSLLLFKLSKNDYLVRFAVTVAKCTGISFYLGRKDVYHILTSHVAIMYLYTYNRNLLVLKKTRKI